MNNYILAKKLGEVAPVKIHKSNYVYSNWDNYEFRARWHENGYVVELYTDYRYTPMLKLIGLTFELVLDLYRRCKEKLVEGETYVDVLEFANKIYRSIQYCR